MPGRDKSLRGLTHEFFGYYPDYLFCQTLALNVENGVTAYQDALDLLARKARAARENSNEIEERLDRRKINVGGRQVRIKELSLREIMGQDEAVLKEIAVFYLKHPYAHGRTRRIRFLPRWARTLFLSALFGHCKRHELDLDYNACFDLLRLL